MNERILTATKNLGDSMLNLMEAEKKVESATRNRDKARQAVKVATEEIRAIRDEINNPV